MQLSKILQGLGYTPDSIMREIMQPCNEMIKQCYIRYTKTSCEELFFVSRAAEGYCCSFNSMLAKYNYPYYLCWTLLNICRWFICHWFVAYFISKVPETNVNTVFRVCLLIFQQTHKISLRKKPFTKLKFEIPMWELGAGSSVGLEVVLSPDADDYVSFFKSFYAIDIAIHSRESFADSGSFFALLPGYNVNVYLTPSVVISDEIVRSLPVSQRNCLFEDEVQSIEKRVFFP